MGSGWTKIPAIGPGACLSKLKINGCQEPISGKHTKNYGKSPFLMGKSTINGDFQ
jgi:hypothetical protein